MTINKNHPLGRRAKVTIDGREVRNCLEADDVEGTIITSGPPQFEAGFRIPHDATNETHRGEVRITFDPPLTREERKRWGGPVEG